eukprot:11180116-Lingulodinium_polyedra.AAC.1
MQTSTELETDLETTRRYDRRRPPKEQPLRPWSASLQSPVPMSQCRRATVKVPVLTREVRPPLLR